MKTFPSTVVFVALILLMCAAPASALAGMVTREVAEKGGGLYEVTLWIEHLDAAGIVERLPEDAALLECSLPPSRMRADGSILAMATMNESRVRYTLRDEAGMPVLDGVWEDLITGERGYVTERQAGPTPWRTTAAPAVTRAGVSALLPVSAIIAGLCIVFWRRGERR
ncbi:MAG: hypothetical protein QHG99_05865 [Methanomicrobiales archaeon]|nr:hypothetical protein [Methanomicrobiales archaeon]